MNGFVDGSGKRGDLREIGNIGVDLDFYKFGVRKEQVMEEVNRLVGKGRIGWGNLSLYGGGMELIYSICGGGGGIMGYMGE
ncbi:hypothetical protein [Bacillus thuringiensis]|uniref:hypothetical protein n=1 Tax=Bacillus thuringiensis TaxID=1428 RepID=UPI00119F2B24|nr:hypothetical protein [Bacillus thuringiensis]